MGLTAITSAATSSAATSSASSAATSSAISLTSTVGAGVGGIFVAAALVFLLAYYDLLGASDEVNEQVGQAVLTAIVPLGFVFAGIVLFHSMQVLN